MKKTAVAVIEWLLAPNIITFIKLTIRLKFITAVDNLI